MADDDIAPDVLAALTALWNDFTDRCKAHADANEDKPTYLPPLLRDLILKGGVLFGLHVLEYPVEPDVRACALWTVANMDNVDPLAWTYPPPPGALAYANWARKDRKQFYGWVAKQLFPTAAERQEKETLQDDDGGPAERTTERLLAHAQNALQASRPDRSGWEPVLPEGNA